MQARPSKALSPPQDDPARLGSRQLVLEWGHHEAKGEDDFMVCPGNALAFEHIVSFPNWAGPLTLMEGPAKAGKTHLAGIWSGRAGAVAAGVDDLEHLAREGGSVPILIEDVDRRAFDENGLFHLLNQSMRDGRPLLMTARAPIGAWPYRTNDVRSRARLAAWFSIEAPDDILLSQMMVKLFADRQLSVDPKVIAYLVARMERSSQEAVGLVDTLDRLALSRGRAITRALAAEALALRASELPDRESES